MSRRPHPAPLLASLAWLACASGQPRQSSSAPPPLTDPFTTPVSSAVVRKAPACQKPEDCGLPPAGIAWECRLGACTPTSPATKEPPADEQPTTAEIPPPLPDLEPPAKGPPPDRSTLPPGLFAPSPSPAPIAPSPGEPPPPSGPPASPPPAPPPPAAPAPAPPAAPTPPTTPPPSTPPPG
jgi:hypothetical protein